MTRDHILCFHLKTRKNYFRCRYDFAEVSRWFAERSDLILLLFDSYKLDISDEFKGVIESLKDHDDKVHCVLNKADALDPEALMKVYGALLWSMAKIMKGTALEYNFS